MITLALRTTGPGDESFDPVVRSSPLLSSMQSLPPGVRHIILMLAIRTLKHLSGNVLEGREGFYRPSISIGCHAFYEVAAAWEGQNPVLPGQQVKEEGE